MPEATVDDTITISTLQFGDIEVPKNLIFRLKDGMLGFEQLKNFVLISDEDTAPFKWMLSVESPEIGFPMLSPWHIDLGYNPGKQYMREDKVLLVVVTLENDKGVMTANMKAPVVFDAKKQTAEQVILHSDKYKTDYEIRTK